MDKETLSNYGWIVIAVLVLVVMIALATPFGSFVSEAVQSTTKGLFDVNKSALDSTGLINIDNQEFDVPNMNHGAGDDEGSGETPVAPSEPETTVSYEITSGANSTIKLVIDTAFCSNADYSKFESVKIDGNTVSSDCYTVTEGSTVITLKASYVKTLANGNHTIDIISNDGYATATFNVNMQPTITFHINNYDETANNGATWREYLETLPPAVSEIRDGQVFLAYGSLTIVRYSDNTPVGPDDIIIPNYTYLTINGGGSND